MMPSTPNTLRRLAALLALAAAALPAAALYKVVNPDGTVTYTDRPPVDNSSRITPMSRTGRPAPNAAAPESSLPGGLRETAQRWPVTLYTAVECSACEPSRQWLAQRGIPYAEKRVLTEEDALALERIVGGRTVPSLSIGAQPLRGFSEADWAAYLDVAGYPRESRLPRNWQAPPATPLVERSTPAATRNAAPQPAPAAAELPQPTSGVRF
jgi:glutaredoxin